MTTTGGTRPTFDSALRDLHALLDRLPLPELRDTRIFATGCTGFVGYWLLSAIECLNRRGQDIEVIALSRDPGTFLTRFPEFANRPWLVPWAGDVVDFRLPEGRFDWIIHGASDTSPQAADRPEAVLHSMGAGTRHLLDGFATRGCRGFLLLSSGVVYGEQPADLAAFPEAHSLPTATLANAEPYAEGKRLMERKCATPPPGLPAAVVARCFAFLGPHLQQHLAPSQFMRDALGGRAIEIRGNGTPRRSYLYAADLALWLLTLLVRGTAGRAYNVGGETPISMAELAELIRGASASAAPVRILGTATDGPRRSYIPDITRARHELGLDAWTPVSLALSRMADSLRDPAR